MKTQRDQKSVAETMADEEKVDANQKLDYKPSTNYDLAFFAAPDAKKGTTTEKMHEDVEKFYEKRRKYNSFIGQFFEIP